jgi:hypothetical protein
VCEPTHSMATATVWPAQQLGPGQRQQIAVGVLAGACTVSYAAQENDVSRKFVYQQLNTARLALQEAFDPVAAQRDEDVLFTVAVTKAWLKQLVLALLLICHSSYRGVTELLLALFDHPMSIGTVHHIVREAVGVAEFINSCQDLSTIHVGAHDEIFQAGDPVLVGADVFSTYCYLLSQEEHRDGDTWAIRILELRDQGFAPETIVGDAGKGLCSGQQQAIPTTGRQGDVFHVLNETQPLIRFLDNRAYDAIATLDKLEREQARAEKRQQTQSKNPQQVQASDSDRTSQPAQAAKTQPKPSSDDRAKQRDDAAKTQTQAIRLADEVALLLGWLHRDVLGVAGPDYATRCELYDFIVFELKKREEQFQHRIRPVRRMLENQRKEVLSFAEKLDAELEKLAAKYGLAVASVREVFNLQQLPQTSSKRWQREAYWWETLGGLYWQVQQATQEVARRVVRASSVIENLNSRLRNYFFLRRELGQGYLELLRFFLNHRKFLRSEHEERAGKSPAELLTGKEHPHWLEMLGFTLFRKG